ncbi:LysR family transcriptional regulator [Microbacterium sp. SD291]|uniref:LysR family transcriptional regulator n=1 Tax=Microbacterium sp. SD291 TaxID=2782007 RepID=UPI001A96E37C|nr:LysR family transcriptional regulator [Microbacterium sp. SD291]MBO0979290.1 LysR family transcriptional regulator [Microbacterium sp. SD291]
MKIIHLRRFVAVADTLHFPRAAEALGTSLAAVYSSIEKLEEEVGHPLITRGGETRLTPAGTALLPEAREMIAAAPTPPPKPAPSGGKAKASKGKGRTPAVKGQPKPYKKRQGR